jgi:Uncharacterized protein containing a Zn-ribbon (DUF2116)
MDNIDTCLVCGTEIPPGPDFCSETCEAQYETDVEAPSKHARTMSATDLIEWLAQYAYDAKRDWGWIRRELLARIQPDMLEGRKQSPGKPGATVCEHFNEPFECPICRVING